MVKYQTDHQKEMARRKEHYRKVDENIKSQKRAILNRQIIEKNEAMGKEKVSGWCKLGIHKKVMCKDMELTNGSKFYMCMRGGCTYGYWTTYCPPNI